MFGFTKRDAEYQVIDKMIDKKVRRIQSRSSSNSSTTFVKNYTFGSGGGSLSGGDNLVAENLVQVIGYYPAVTIPTQTTRAVLRGRGGVYIDLTHPTVAEMIVDPVLNPHTWEARY